MPEAKNSDVPVAKPKPPPAAGGCTPANRPKKPPAGYKAPPTPAAKPGFVWVKGEYVCKKEAWTWVSDHWERARRPAPPVNPD
jgi:hypothetical protein